MASVKSVIAFAITSSIATIAQAADLPPLQMPVPPPLQRAVIDDMTSGWYLRGDVGYRWNDLNGATTTAPFVDPINNTLKNGAALGGGIGLKAGWVRADFTLDYGLPVKYLATTLAVGDTTARISSLTGLLNVYFDLGTWSGVTPYIGAGVGAGRLHTAGYASAGAPPFGNPADNSRWNMAWAAMTGVSYGFSRSLALDLGYRYLGLGDAQTATDAFGKTTLNNLRAHEVRLGFRWMLGEGLLGM